MKDSGVPWIGEIPKNWGKSSMKYIGGYINGYAFKPDDWSSKGLPIIRIQDLTGSNEDPNYYEGQLNFKYLIKPNDILISWAATLDAFVWKGPEGWLNQHIFKALPNKDLVTTGYFLWLVKIGMLNMNNENKHGIVMQHVTAAVFNNFRVPLPPKQEQQRIADFLDAKCAEIDSILEKTQTSIEEYKALKQSVITEAVTKGIRGNRPMKDSGVECIGKIPMDWGIMRIRNIGRTQNGISKGAEYFGSGTPFVSYSDVYKNGTLPKSVNGLVQSSEQEQEAFSVRKGDIFFTRTSETIEEIGFSSVCLESIPKAVFAGFLIRLRPKDNTVIPEYSKYYYRSDVPRVFFVKEMNLVTRASLSQDLLKSLPVLVPPPSEQREIASYLDEKCATIDSLIASKEALITELEAYKKSLIYEYVTGKKEVL